MSVARRVASWLGALVRRVWGLPKWLVIPGGLLLLAVIALTGYKAQDFYQYTQYDPGFCRSCHLMEKAWDKWSSSEHRNVSCHECHQLSPVAGARLIITFALTRPERLEKHTSVSDGVCAKCHEGGDPRWRQVAATVGHRTHAQEQNIACTKCHAISLHRFTPPNAICQLCHGEKRIEIAAMTGQHCLNCHQFLRPGVASGASAVAAASLTPGRGVCLECHLQQQGSRVTWPAGAPMQFECSQCHKPHVQTAPVVDCKACHAESATRELHTKGPHQAAKCQVCHEPHKWSVTQRSTCLTCHANKPQHGPEQQCQACHRFN